MRLFKKRSVYVPTLSGFVLLAGLVLLGTVFLGRNIVPILSVDNPISEANLIVVEGWNSDRAVAESIRRFREDEHYDFVCATGADIERGARLGGTFNWADFTAERIHLGGLPRENIISAPAGKLPRHRTFYSAVALRERLKVEGIEVQGINLVTEQTHTRRSLMQFRKAFEGSCPIGVIPMPSEGFDPERWWASSTGAKTIVMEVIAVLYEWLGDSGR